MTHIGFVFSELCDFENGLCSYTQATTDTMDWKYTTGAAGVGPNIDHTNMARTGLVDFTLSSSLYTCALCLQLPALFFRCLFDRLMAGFIVTYVVNCT